MITLTDRLNNMSVDSITGIRNRVDKITQIAGEINKNVVHRNRHLIEKQINDVKKREYVEGLLLEISTLMVMCNLCQVGMDYQFKRESSRLYSEMVGHERDIIKLIKAIDQGGCEECSYTGVKTVIEPVYEDDSGHMADIGFKKCSCESEDDGYQDQDR